MEIPYSGRAVIDENFDGMEITIPAKKNWFIILFLGVWLCMWLGGEIFASSTIISGNAGGAPDVFLIVWICGWTVGGVFALRTFWWTLAGKEVISIGHGALTLDKRGALFYKAKTYDLREAQNFRAQEEAMPYGPFGSVRPRLFNMKNSGTIKFDYGLQTVKFADGMDEAEANFILQKLRNKKLIT